MYIALIQNNPKTGALRQNANQALEALDALASQAYPPDLVILPAYALTGAPVDGLGFSDAFAAECLDIARAFMEKASLPVIAGTLIPRPLEEEGGFVCEPEVLFCRGDGSRGTLGFVDFENEWSAHAYAASVTTEIDGHTVSVILEGYPEPEDDYSDSDIVIILLAKEYRGTNSMLTSSYQLGYLRTFAQAANTWVVVSNLVGAQDDMVFDGASVVIKPDGTVAAAAEPFSDTTITCNLVLDKSLQPKTVDPTPSDDAVIVKPLLPYEADWRALKLSVHDYVTKNGFTDVVIGLSGGIDSAVTAALAVDALGAEHVHGVLMPGPYSSEGSVTDALALAANLGVQTLTLPITEPLGAFLALSQEVLGQEGSFLAKQNIQARIRTIHLMHLSNTFGWLLLNTGNKSEAAMGFSTLYGDTAGALAPLGNIYKTDVYGLAQWRNEQHLVIPVEVIEKPPSAELYEGQKDQDSLPPYDVLDRILRLHIEEGFGVDQIVAVSYDDPDGEVLPAELVEQVLNTVRKAEYKRRQEPLAPSLGFADMGADREWPITNGFEDHHRDLKLDVGIGIGDYLGMIRTWKQPEGWDFLAN